MTIDTVKLPELVKPKAKVYIKDGMRKMMTDSGYMKIGAPHARRTFGKLQGGKYSQSQ